MADAAHSACGPRIPQTDGLPQEIHPLIRRDRRAAHHAAQAGGIPLVAGGRRGVRVLECRAHLRTGALAFGLCPIVHHRL
jgi:hypothetical protein